MRILAVSTLFALALCSTPAISDELISKNWLSSQEDWYLIEDSIKKTKVNGVYSAQNYLSMHQPDDEIELFDGDFKTIGFKYVGSYQSVAYITLFDCQNGETAELAVRYYSGETPHGSNVVWEEYFEFLDFSFPLNEDLFARVCTLSATLD